MYRAETIAEAKFYAKRDYPNESCGFIADGAYVPCMNIAEDKTKNFKIIPDMWVKVSGIEAVIHSHPNGPDCPSAADMKCQMETGLPWGIIVTNGTDVADPFWWGGNTPVAPLVGRVFRHGVTDCYSLIRDYYSEEMDVELPDFPREWEWWKNGADFYRTLYKQAGFRRVEDGPQISDVFLAQIRSKVPNHGGVYTGNGLILHHLQDQLSRHEPMGDKGKFITHWLRHETR